MWQKLLIHVEPVLVITNLVVLKHNQLQQRGLIYYVQAMKINPLEILQNAEISLELVSYGFHRPNYQCILFLNLIWLWILFSPCTKIRRWIKRKEIQNLTKCGIDVLNIKCTIYSSNWKERHWKLAVFYTLFQVSRISRFI